MKLAGTLCENSTDQKVNEGNNDRGTSDRSN